MYSRRRISLDNLISSPNACGGMWAQALIFQSLHCLWPFGVRVVLEVGVCFELENIIHSFRENYGS